MIVIYYRRKDIYMDWPFNDEIDERIVEFSTSHKHFQRSIFLKLDPSLSIDERKKAVFEKLPVKDINKIKLIKLGGQK